MSEDPPVFLSTIQAGQSERRVAATLVLLSAAAFATLAPFAKVPLGPVTAFIPIYESVLIVNDLTTATLLFSQFSILRSRALWLLACGYLFTACTTAAHAVSFPGLFSQAGLLGGDPQTTAWLYALWHGGFPLYVAGYALLKRERRDVPEPRRPIVATILAAMPAVAALPLLLAASHGALPVILFNNAYTALGSTVLTSVWMLSILALGVVYWRKPHSQLDLWLLVVMAAWVFDIALSAVLNGGRFDFGFYAGRVYGALATSFVLMMLLRENGRLYLRLARAHERKRAETADLKRLNTLIERRMEERTAALKALHVKEEELKAIVENVFDCVITIDTNGIVCSANKAVERVLGYPPDELIGRNVSMLMAEPYRSRHDSWLANYCRTGVAGIIGIGREVEGLHKNGERVALDLAVTEYRVGEQRYFVGTLHDIRERKRFIAELTEARTEAERANRAKAHFLAAMSHEIRTPMNGVIGMLEVLHQSSLKGYQVEMVDLINESARSLLTIIDDILDFSKIEAGRLEIESAPLSLAEVTEKVGGLLDHLATRKGVELTLFVDPRLPEQVLGDALRLSQMLINLSNNAIKFSSGQPRAGKVSLRAMLTELRDNVAHVAFQVADNGVGMDEKTVSQLFSPFAQGDVSTTRRFGGTGLGLAISRNLAQLMGGDIAVDSAPGVGSTFTLRLPFPLPLPPSDAAHPRSAIAGLSCLVVGGADSLADDLASYLRAEGAVVDQASDLSVACARKVPPTADPSVWIIDTGHGEPAAPDLVRASAGCDRDVRFVVVGRGPRRYPRLRDGNQATIDGNVLSRRMLVRAVAIASGRGHEEETPPTGRKESEFRPVSREEALRRSRLILVAEDNETNQQVILRQFALLGYAADVADDGIEALRRWRSGDYALLLTDLHMPRMDGYQLTAAVRAEEDAERRIPIVALTANAQRAEAEQCRAAGMDECLTKPVHLADLRTVLERFLPPATEEFATAPMDVGVLKALVGDDPLIVRELLCDFRASTARIADDLRTACLTGDAAAAGAAAHKLTSAARSVGASALAAHCASLEQAGRTGSAADLTTLLPQFEQEMTRVNRHLAALLVTEPSAPVRETAPVAVGAS